MARKDAVMLCYVFVVCIPMRRRLRFKNVLVTSLKKQHIVTMLQYVIMTSFPTVPVVSLTMDEANGNVLLGSINGTLNSGAALMSGQVGKGVNFLDEISYVDLGFWDSQCFYDPDFCTEGITFAMWIKNGPGSQTGGQYLLDTGAYYSAGKGNCGPFTNMDWLE